MRTPRISPETGSALTLQRPNKAASVIPPRPQATYEGLSKAAVLSQQCSPSEELSSMK